MKPSKLTIFHVVLVACMVVVSFSLGVAWNSRAETAKSVSAVATTDYDAIAAMYGGTSTHPDGFVTGTYSKYCYPSGSQPRSIRKAINYQTLAECGKPLK